MAEHGCAKGLSVVMSFVCREKLDSLGSILPQSVGSEAPKLAVAAGAGGAGSGKKKLSLAEYRRRKAAQ